jgi:hypothetical protein
LQVRGSSEILRIEDSSSTGNPYMSFYQNGTRRGLIQLVNGGLLSLVSEYGDIRFMTGTGGTEVERMRIDSSGNVGIGNTNPSSDLQIASVKDGMTNGLNTNQLKLNYDASVVGAGSSVAFGVSSDNNFTGAKIVHERTGSNSVGDLTFWTRSTSGSSIDWDLTEERMRITSGGDIEVTGGYVSSQAFQSIGALRVSSNSTTDTGNVALELLNDATGTRYLASFSNLNGVVGSISTLGSATSYNTSSDYRLKENVVEMTGALDRVDALKPSRFNFIADADKTVDGFLAHEVAEVVPEAISGEKDAVDEEGNAIYQGIDQSKIVPLLVGAIQELKAEIETLKSQINN